MQGNSSTHAVGDHPNSAAWVLLHYITSKCTVLPRVLHPPQLLLNSYLEGTLANRRCTAVSQSCYPSTTAASELSSLTNICCLASVSSSLQDCCLLDDMLSAVLLDTDA